MAVKLMLPAVRGSFLVLGKPEQYQGKGPFRWSATGLVPYNSAIDKKVRECLLAAAEEKWGAKGAKNYEIAMADKKACCYVDGKFKDYDGYEGHFALTAHRYQDKGRPLVKDNDTSPIYKPDDELYPGKAGRIYSGCFINLLVEFWAQDNSNGKGLRATLLGVQRVRDGDAFGGGSRPRDEDFEEVDDGANAEDFT